MDRYKIVFVCKQSPQQSDGFIGFRSGEYYEGRSFNGLFEINSKWGSGSESKLISKSLFEKYFELIESDTMVKTSA